MAEDQSVSRVPILHHVVLFSRTVPLKLFDGHPNIMIPNLKQRQLYIDMYKDPYEYVATLKTTDHFIRGFHTRGTFSQFL